MTDNNNPWDNDNDELDWNNGSSKSKNSVAKRFKIINNNPKDNIGAYIKYGLLLILGLWILSGFYQVQPSEEGVVLRFGKYVYTTDAGLHYHLPVPIEEVIKVNVTQERSINLGTAADVRDYRNNDYTKRHMLNGDENIVHIILTKL